MAFISIICVAVVVISIGFIIVKLNWDLGVSESLCIVISIGLSVDYCVHLASDYLWSPHSQRRKKMKQTFQNVGISITSGAITTIGSSAFLFGGEIVLFQKFAIIICSTITISFLVAMVLFGSFMHICGPVNGQGDIVRMCQNEDYESEDMKFDDKPIEPN